MNIVLFHMPADGNNYARWDGYSIRNGGHGISGSHQSFVIIAEQLVKARVISTAYLYNFCNDVVVNGVNYISDNQKVASEIDTLVIPSWYAKNNVTFSNIKQQYPQLKRLVVWFQCQLLDGTMAESLTQMTPQVEVVFMHVSQWSRLNIMKMMPSKLLERVSKHYVIPNPLMSDCLSVYNAESRGTDAVFFACFERGGEVAERVWKALKKHEPSVWGSFKSLQYNVQNACNDKMSLFATLSTARYFIYPLVLPPSYNSYSVHRDTFGCCVAEALANGVEVLSYPVGALEEHYGDMVHWIPFPPRVTKEIINNSVYDPKVPELFGDVQVAVIVEMMRKLNDTYNERATQRQLTAEKVRQLYNAERVGKMWMVSIDDMKSIPVTTTPTLSHAKSKRGLLL